MAGREQPLPVLSLVVGLSLGLELGGVGLLTMHEPWTKGQMTSECS